MVYKAGLTGPFASPVPAHKARGTRTLEPLVPYSIFLLASGVFFTLAERIWPRQPQPVNRRQYGLDLVYAFFNAEVVGALVAIWLSGLYAGTGFLAWRGPLGLNALALQPAWVQLTGLLVVKDFLQW